MPRRQLDSAPAHRGVGVGEGIDEQAVVEHAESFEGAERRFAHTGIAGGQATPRRLGIAGVPGDGDLAAVRHCLSRSVSVVTIHARLNAVTVASTAPMTSANPELATTAHTRRSAPAGWYGGATASRTW